VATELTNEQCSFWHFRFDLHVGMKAEVMVRALPEDRDEGLFDHQDYLFGQSVQREVKNISPKLRPTSRCGREIDPARQDQGLLALSHQDQASGAQALPDRQLGPRLNLLIKAGVDSGADLNYYTFYALWPAARPRSATAR